MNQRRPKFHKPGLPPGTLVYTGEAVDIPAAFRLMYYTETGFEESEGIALSELSNLAVKEGIYWLDIYGLGDVKAMAELAGHFGIHPMAMEDVLNTLQIPKCEVFEAFVLFTLKMLKHVPESETIDLEHVGLILTGNIVLSFQEKSGDVFEPVRERIRHGGGRIRRKKADYLLFALCDVMIDHYYLAIDHIFEKSLRLESRLIKEPAEDYTDRILNLRKEVMQLRRVIYPLREAVSQLSKAGDEYIDPDNNKYFNDLSDQSVNLSGSIIEAEDILRGCMELQQANQGNRLNNVMKVLTIVSTTFIPLTFIAGVYGMNFDWMPELGFRWAYPAVLLIMLAMGIVMMIYFKRKGWY